MRYQFNGFEVDTLQFKLFYAGKTLSLEPKVFDLLVYLLKHRQRTVTREELFDSVWQGQVVGDTTLSNHINSARKILGDNGNEQTVIATLRGRGYQFIAETEEVTSHKSIPLTPFVRHKNWFYFIFIIFSLLLTGFLLTHFVKSQSGLHKALRIAVLPFINVKQDPKTNYLGFAIADQIIGNIAYLEQVTVRASASVRKYEMQTIDPIKVGKELNVEYILTGNYMQQAGLIRLNIELIEVGSNNLLWRESIQSKSGDSFKLHTQLVQTIVQQLNLQLSSSDIKHMNMDIPASAQAYDFYLRAIAYPITVKGSKLAIAMLEKSLEFDENFAPTYVELGYRTNHLAVFNLRPNLSAKDKAIEYYIKAISLNPDSRNALSGLADIYTETGKTGEAVELLRRLISLNPSDAQARFSLGYSYRYAGMTLEAIAEMELALAIDPYNPKFRSIILSYDAAGFYEQALNVKYAFEESPASLAFKVNVLIHLEKMAEALALVEQVIELETRGLWHNDAVILKAIITGDHETGLQGVRKFEASEISDAEAYFHWARYYALLGEKQGCFRLLGKAINNGYFNYPFISTTAYFDSVRGEVEFQELLTLAKKKHLDFKQKYF